MKTHLSTTTYASVATLLASHYASTLRDAVPGDPYVRSCLRSRAAPPQASNRSSGATTNCRASDGGEVAAVGGLSECSPWSRLAWCLTGCRAFRGGYAIDAIDDQRCFDIYQLITDFHATLDTVESRRGEGWQP